MILASREVILGISAGISAYKSADLLRRLQELNFDVTVIPTQSSLNFVGSATWEALSGHPVQTNLWNNVYDVPHIKLAKKASLIIIAPTTADLLAKIANGLADDLLTNVVLAANAPLILVPAMHPEMWANAATQENVAKLRSRGALVIEPDEGRMTGLDYGVGRYPTVEKIVSQNT
jgi:phosphopantothenoylcysteine decarboxylase / phosphopantothenate---cysteine ligase